MDIPKPAIPPVTIADQTRGMSAGQVKRFLTRMAKATEGKPAQRIYLSEIQALQQVRDRLRVRYCSEPRLELATDNRCEPLPGVQCECGHCRHLGREWPGIYLVSVMDRDTNTRAQISYSCWLHSQSDDFLNALPSSSSIVRFK